MLLYRITTTTTITITAIFVALAFIFAAITLGLFFPAQHYADLQNANAINALAG